MSPLLARLFAFGDVPFTLRIGATLVGAAITLAAALIARELGSGRGAQVLAIWRWSHHGGVIAFDPPRTARHIRHEWAVLSSPPTSVEIFDSDRTANLPEPVGKWLRHSIRQETPLAATAWLRMRGHIRLGAWRPFTATQVLAPGIGFIWAATAKIDGIPVLGYDKYVDHVGEMRWRIGGLIPVMSARNDDISRSAAGRLAAESVLVPTSFAGAQWCSDDAGVHAIWSINSYRETMDLDIGDDGQLHGVCMQRWGNPGGAPFGRYPFGVAFESDREFGGVTIPTKVRAGWWWHTDRQADGEFFRATITDAAFR